MSYIPIEAEIQQIPNITTDWSAWFMCFVISPNLFESLLDFD